MGTRHHADILAGSDWIKAVGKLRLLSYNDDGRRINLFMNNELKIIDCFCAWYDLLGYGVPFKEAKWNLHDVRCVENYNRVKQLQKIITIPHAYVKTLMINDGVIKTFDISDKTPDESMNQIINFLVSFIEGFQKINEKDKVEEQFGVRGVFTYGQRFDYMGSEGIYTASSGEMVVYHPKEFQMNTAFSKANIIEESGSKHGVSGPKLYFDYETLKKIKELSECSRGYQVIENRTDRGFEFNINLKGTRHCMIRLIFERDLISYDYKEIKTELCRFIKVEQDD